MFISRIPDPKQQQKRGVKKNLLSYLFLATNFTKLKIILVFLSAEEKNLGQFSKRIIERFTQKIVTKLSKIWVWDPGSGNNLFRFPDPGVPKRHRIPDPQHCLGRVRGYVGGGIPAAAHQAGLVGEADAPQVRHQHLQARLRPGEHHHRAL